MTKINAFVKSPITSFLVIPAKAGIQEKQALLDPGFRRGDGFDDFLRAHQTSSFEIPWSPLAPPKAGKPCSTFDIHSVD
jgi:hypothetical protein